MKNDIYQNMFTLAGKKALIPGGTGGLEAPLPEPSCKTELM